MQTKVPPLEVTRQIIVDAKGEKFLKTALPKIQQKYRNVTDPSFQMWLLAKSEGLEVPEIKAGAADEGEAFTVGEITVEVINEERRKEMRQQRKFSLTGVLMDLQYGESSKQNPKVEFVFTDGTGICKGAGYKAAAENFAAAKVKIGDVVKLPYASIWAGTHNFDPNEKNKLWWKLSVPPFGDGVVKLDADPAEFFRNLESDGAEEGAAVFGQGIITNLNPRENDLCSVCGAWYLDGKEEEHENCTEEDGWHTVAETSYEGTLTLNNGATNRLIFKAEVGKPKIRVCDDEVQVFGKYTKNGGIEVLLLRKHPEGSEDEWVNALPPRKQKFRGSGRKNGGDEGSEETEDEAPKRPSVKIAGKAPIAKPKGPVKVAVKTKPAAPPDEEEAEEGEETEEAEDEAPAPAPRKLAKAPVPVGKKIPVKAPPAEDEGEEEVEEEAEEEEEDEPAPPKRKAVIPAKKPLKPASKRAEPDEEPEEAEEEVEDPDEEPEVEETEEEDEEPAPAPKGKPKVASKAAPAAKANGKDDPVLAYMKRTIIGFGGQHRVFMLARGAGKLGIIDGETEDEWKANIQPHIDAAVKAGKLQYVGEQKQIVKWAGN